MGGTAGAAKTLRRATVSSRAGRRAMARARKGAGARGTTNKAMTTGNSSAIGRAPNFSFLTMGNQSGGGRGMGGGGGGGVAGGRKRKRRGK